jgi:hypothetical protein
MIIPTFFNPIMFDIRQLFMSIWSVKTAEISASLHKKLSRNEMKCLPPARHMFEVYLGCDQGLVV